MEDVLVSIVIPTRNRSSLLGRAVRSALGQTYKNIEVIIVDDASTDDTFAVTQTFIDKMSRIRYIQHSLPRGGNAARNSGILAATGLFIAGLDDDDEFTADRIARLVQEYDPKYSVIAARNVLVTATGRQRSPYLPLVSLDTLLYYNCIGNQVLVERERILAVGLFDEQLLRFQDYDMWVRLVQRYGPARILPDDLQLVYYNHMVGPNARGAAQTRRGGQAFYLKHRDKMSRIQRVTWIRELRPRGTVVALVCSALRYVRIRKLNLLAKCRWLLS